MAIARYSNTDIYASYKFIDPWMPLSEDYKYNDELANRQKILDDDVSHIKHFFDVPNLSHRHNKQFSIHTYG